MHTRQDFLTRTHLKNSFTINFIRNLFVVFISLFYIQNIQAQQPQAVPAPQPKMTIKDAKIKCKKEGKTEEALIECIKQNTLESK